ncbi:DMT family transporter [Tomitella gaofuii]|uniref:DMT family transporter n=1 Tax=Tomitella gaofuii TaxID=2760083 RepID=UPI0015F8D276|nr:DMT family transporter [Tomitella gaofuii]
MLVYVLAILTAAVNAAASVLQRAANRKRPADELFHPRLIARILREPMWFAGLAAMIASFVLMAAALASGPIVVVEPLLMLDLPFTLVIARAFFGRRTRAGEWRAVAAITVGLAALLFLLAPSGGDASHVPGRTWLIGLGASAGLIAVFAVLGGRAPVGSLARPALLSLAAGTGFGVTTVLTKAFTTDLVDGGLAGAFATWHVYGLLAAGALAFFLLQVTFGSGPLIAAQPGLTGTEPVVAMVWGVVVFGEQVRGGWYAALAVAAVALIAAGVAVLGRSFAAAGSRD